MRRVIPVLALTLLCAFAAPRSAHAVDDFEPLLMGLGIAKIPGIAFDAVGGFRILSDINNFEEPALRRAAEASMVSNFVTLGLHTLSVTSFFVGSLHGDDIEDRILPTFAINGIADLSIAVLGIATGVDLWLQIKAAGITGTPLGISATWSSVVNLVMGSFGGVWFLPMAVGALVSANELYGLHWEPKDSALASIRIDPGPTSVSIHGRFW